MASGTAVSPKGRGAPFSLECRSKGLPISRARSFLSAPASSLRLDLISPAAGNCRVDALPEHEDKLPGLFSESGDLLARLDARGEEQPDPRLLELLHRDAQLVDEIGRALGFGRLRVVRADAERERPSAEASSISAFSDQ